MRGASKASTWSRRVIPVTNGSRSSSPPPTRAGPSPSKRQARAMASVMSPDVTTAIARRAEATSDGYSGARSSNVIPLVPVGRERAGPVDGRCPARPTHITVTPGWPVRWVLRRLPRSMAAPKRSVRCIQYPSSAVTVRSSPTTRAAMPTPRIAATTRPG